MEFCLNPDTDLDSAYCSPTTSTPPRLVTFYSLTRSHRSLEQQMPSSSSTPAMEMPADKFHFITDSQEASNVRTETPFWSHRKPDPRIFKRTRKLLSFKPSVDIFDSAQRHKLPCYVSTRPDLAVGVVDLR